jgi:Putative Ig domain
MLSAEPMRRRRAGIRVSLCLCLLAALALPAAAAAAPAYSGGHLYRHGVVPFRGHQNAALAAPSSANALHYGGAISGVGVTTAAPRVYLVFWGSQWGSQSTNSSGYATFSGDPRGVAPDLQAFFTGIGTGHETWSGVMTQYCQGVATGAQSCPQSNTQHVGYPTGGALAGVWEDTSAAAPSAASAHQIGVEAVNAATHFGNTTQSSNLPAQYVIISPTGADPDHYKTGGFCAWHDYTGDTTLDGGGAVSSPDGLLAFTNLPYIPDAGASCGQSFVNPGSAGALDGVTIVDGHEYAETITDTYPAGGWTDSSGAENADKCAWISSGQGAAQDISLSTGSFAVQSTWANDFNNTAGGCEVSHPIVGQGNTVTVTNPGSQTSVVGTSVSLHIVASDSASGQTLTYSATGLPGGLSINSSTGVISGTPTTTGTSSVTVRAVDTTGASGTASFTWKVTPSGGCTAKQLLGNTGFETGSAAPWTTTPGVIRTTGGGESPHSGQWFAGLDGYGVRHTDRLTQAVTIGSACHTDSLSFWLWIGSTEATSSAIDTLKVQVLNSSGTVLATLATYSNLNANSQYVQHSFNLSAYAAQKIKVRFTGTETDKGGGTTHFLIDDAALNQAS